MNPRSLAIGNYVPGTSWLHRAPLWAKVLGCVAAGLCTFVVRDPLISGGLVLLALLAFLSSGMGLRSLGRLVVTSGVVLVLIGVIQWWQIGLAAAATIVLNIFLCVVCAAILTATTPLTVLIDGLVSAAKPFQRLGADPERFALAVAIMLRSIPYLLGTFAQVRDAARARGLERSPRALLLPTFITAVAYARRTGEALAARGLGD
ncbi:energy-coupling factor transporter transmembrane component T family protein [Pseudarthrobacter sp. J1738]|uniref:energy-coupling factor transporter transmembrane component T family protein n=1 Tax=unclassified Pseudarthrobacter TaxID=2647000 RepID=UPI003D2812F3